MSNIATDALQEAEKLVDKPVYAKGEKKNPLSIGEARVILNNQQPLFAAMLQACQVKVDKTVPTAGVRVSGRCRVEMSINQDFWDSLEQYEGVGLLMHEMLHIAFEHLTRGKNLEPKIANYAMDIAINQYIPSHWLPKSGLMPEMRYPKTMLVAVPTSTEKDAKIVTLELRHPKADQIIWSFEKGKSFEIYYGDLIQLREKRRKEKQAKKEKSEKQKAKQDKMSPQEKEEQKKKQEEQKKQQEAQIADILAKQQAVESERSKLLQEKMKLVESSSLSAKELQDLKSKKDIELKDQSGIVTTQNDINSLLLKLNKKINLIQSANVVNEQAQLKTDMEKLYE